VVWRTCRLYESRAGRRHAPTVPPSPDTSPITGPPPNCGHAVQDRLRKVEENRRKLESLGLVNVKTRRSSACAPRTALALARAPGPRASRSRSVP
jgi:hypothetical protein